MLFLAVYTLGKYLRSTVTRRKKIEAALIRSAETRRSRARYDAGSNSDDAFFVPFEAGNLVDWKVEQRNEAARASPEHLLLFLLSSSSSSVGVSQGSNRPKLKKRSERRMREGRREREREDGIK